MDQNAKQAVKAEMLTFEEQTRCLLSISKYPKLDAIESEAPRLLRLTVGNALA